MLKIIFTEDFIRIILAAVAERDGLRGGQRAGAGLHGTQVGRPHPTSPGPSEVGWHGLLQPFADAGKLVSELLMPDGADAFSLGWPRWYPSCGCWYCSSPSPSVLR